MHAHKNSHRALAALLISSIVLATVAPAANADRGRRYKHREPERRSHVVHRSVYGSPRVVVRESNGAPLLAGLIGGLILGAAVSHAAPPPQYYYYDPYCHERFATLEIYGSHFHRHHHPRVVRVMETRSGQCAWNYRYDQGNWRRFDVRDDRWSDGNWRNDDGRNDDWRDDEWRDDEWRDDRGNDRDWNN
jgi:hypothetical protein